MKKKNIIPILIPNRTYPYNCTWYQQEEKSNLTKENIRKMIQNCIDKETDAEENEITKALQI